MNRGFPSIDADSSSSRFPTFFTFLSLFSCKFRIHEELMEESRNATPIFYFERMHMNRILKWKRLKGFFLSFAQNLEIFFLRESGGNVDCGIQKFVGKGEKFPLLGPGETSPFPPPVSKVSLISRILFFSEVLKGEEGCTFFSFVVLLSRALVQQAKQGRDMSHTPQSCKCMPAAFYSTVKAKKCIHSV